ncbi:MAG: hypothetical protein ACPG77_20335, partial [Nannocystaceae bacterium]
MAQGCGNGELDDGEECDDGNAVDGDGCNVDCVISGQELWTYTLNGLLNEGDAATALAIGGEGSIYVAGKIVNESDDDVWVAKLDPDGELLWASTYAGEGGGNDRAEGIALLGDNVFVAGQLNVGNGADAFLLGMDAKTGEALGAPEVYDFSDGGRDVFQDLVASPSNELILVGNSGTPGQEYPLIAFASGDGVVSDWANYADDGIGSLYDITLAGDHAIVCGNQGSFIQQVAIVRTLDAATGEPIGDSETFFPGAGWLYTGFKCLLTEDDTALVIAGGIHLEDTT